MSVPSCSSKGQLLCYMCPPTYFMMVMCGMKYNLCYGLLLDSGRCGQFGHKFYWHPFFWLIDKYLGRRLPTMAISYLLIAEFLSSFGDVPIMQ